VTSDVDNSPTIGAKSGGLLKPFGALDCDVGRRASELGLIDEVVACPDIESVPISRLRRLCSPE
jgi:hypothetical protein